MSVEILRVAKCATLRMTDWRSRGVASGKDGADARNGGRSVLRLGETDMETTARGVGEVAARKPGIWARQMSGRGTVWQTAFDVAFGIVGPILCVVFDPGVLRPDGWEFFEPLQEVRLFVYLVIGLGIAALSYFLVTRKSSWILAGAMYGAAVFALFLGVVMLPMSALGLLLVIGIFGFTPFVSAFVMWRNARRCRESAVGSGNAWLAGALGFLLILGVPGMVQGVLATVGNRAVARVIAGAGRDVSADVRIARSVRIATRADALVNAYQKSVDLAERERLAKCV